MKVSTLNFIKNNRRLLFILNILIAFLGTIIYLNITKNIFLILLFPWFSSFIIIVDLWIIFCLFTGNVVEIFNITYKRLLKDLILIFVIFYNTLHVVLSMFFSYSALNLWYFFYGVYHLIFALALYNIYKNYKLKIKKNSTYVLKYTGFLLLSAAVTFFIILTFVLREAEKIRFQNRVMIYSFSAMTLANLILSVIYIFKLKHDSSTNFVAHKYINLAAAIFSLFFVQTIFLNEFCRELVADKMQIITLIVGIPCLFTLVFISLKLLYRSYILKDKLYISKKATKK